MPQLAAGIAQVGRVAAAGQLQLQGGQAEVPYPAGRVLLRNGVQRVGPVQAGLRGIRGAAAVHIANQVGEIAAAHPGAVVGVDQNLMLVHFHLIGGILRVQGKDIVCLVEHDHRDTP